MGSEQLSPPTAAAAGAAAVNAPMTANSAAMRFMSLYPLLEGRISAAFPRNGRASAV